jgi:hypothetical protein
MTFTNEQLTKIASLRKIIINHPQFENAYQAIVSAYQMKDKIDLAQNIICVGHSGTGKSTLKERMKLSYPVRQSTGKYIIPVLVVDTPSVPTVKNIAEEMLIQLGDAKFNRGSAIEKTNRILNYMDRCEVKMVIFDELQHFVDQGKKRTPYEVSDWLKTVIDKAKVSTVLMGLDRCEELLHVNEQLRRRFSKRVNIHPFDISDQDSRNSFIGVIKVLDEKVAMPNRMDIRSKDLIKSLYFASNGIIDYLVKIFIGAYEQAVVMGISELTNECFRKAFSENIWVDGVGDLNPFDKNFKNENLDKMGMPFHRINTTPTMRVGM